MGASRVVIAVMVSVLIAGGVLAAERPHVVILATGGTIAGSAETSTQAGYSAGKLGVEVLIDAVPQLKKLARVTGEQVANVGSQDMSDAIWLKLAGRINALLASDAVAGVVVTHGTDTIEETAYFLNLVVKSSKPVVLTAAMRPSTALSADGPLNIYNAVAVAADPEAVGRGVLVVANDDIHGARAVTKSNTTDVQAFQSPERGLMGVSLYGVNRWFRRPYKRHTADTTFDLEDVKALPRVDVLYAHVGLESDLIDAAVQRGAKGLIVAGVGNGNMNEASLVALTRAVKEGVPCVRSTRVPSGSVGRNVEVDDDARGFVASGELNPAKARVLLKLALLQTKSVKKIQAIFSEY